MALLRLTLDEQKSSVYSIEFGSEYAVKIMQTIEKYLPLVYEGTACRFVNKFVPVVEYGTENWTM
jgi:hypothetical protein